MTSSPPSEALEIARHRLAAAEREFDAARDRVFATETATELRAGLLRLRVAALVLLEVMDEYCQAKIRARFGAV